MTTIRVSIVHVPTGREVQVSYIDISAGAINPRSTMRHVSFTEGNPFDEYALKQELQPEQQQAA